MTESKIIDLDTVIGVYSISNTGAVLVHDIDYADDSVLASINGKNPEWCKVTDKYSDEDDEYIFGFYFGELFVPLSDVMRMYSE